MDNIEEILFFLGKLICRNMESLRKPVTRSRVVGLQEKNRYLVSKVLYFNKVTSCNLRSMFNIHAVDTQEKRT
jgi:hypothetical protein